LTFDDPTRFPLVKNPICRLVILVAHMAVSLAFSTVVSPTLPPSKGTFV
jgi:hypothetical protein